MFFRREREFNETRFGGNDKIEVQLQDVLGETAWVKVDHVTGSNVLKEGRNLVKRGSVC